MTEAKLAEEGSNDGHVVDIDKWADSLARLLEDVPQYICIPGHAGRISRVPDTLREINRNAYEPYFLSIGPYHHGKENVQLTETGKLVVLKCFLEAKPELALKDYLMEVQIMEPRARTFYSDVEMDSEKFVRMLLLDSLYIFSALCGMPERIENEETDERVYQINEGIETTYDNENTQILPTISEPNEETTRLDAPRWFWTLFAHDVFLLENQLPFFVLQMLYDLVYHSKSQFMVTMKNVVGELLLSYTKLDSGILILPTEEVHHLLHLCHLFFRPTLLQETAPYQLDHSSQMFRLGSAVQLYEAGVSFEATCQSTHHSLLDITIDNSGKLTIPCLQVDDNTDSLLRNLIALEQMKYPSLGLHVSAYAVLLLHLITAPEDAKLLRRKGIIQHHLASDKEMVHLVNRLSVGLSFDYVEDEYNLKHVFQELKRYTERRVPRWRAWLKHRYLNNPWTVISLLTASVLLLLTALQTYYAVLSYYQPFFSTR